MSASTPFFAVEKMLKQCAPGYEIRLATHSRVIHFAGKLYRTFPKFDTVENGHIRKLVRALEISVSCAAKHLPGVINDEKATVEEAKPPAKPSKAASANFKAPKRR
jgi:hypothetical protein